MPDHPDASLERMSLLKLRRLLRSVTASSAVLVTPESFREGASVVHREHASRPATLWS